MAKSLTLHLAILPLGLVLALSSQAQAQVDFRRLGCGTILRSRGCASTFQEATRATRVDETTIRITVGGNAYTNSDTVYRFAMMRAASETIAAGYDLFEVVEQADTTRQRSGVTGGGFNYGTGRNDPIQSYSYVLPGQAMTVRLRRGAKPADAPANLFDAREVLRFLTSPSPPA